MNTGDVVRIKASGKRGVVTDYFSDDWIVIRVDGKEINVKLAEITKEEDAPQNDQSTAHAASFRTDIGLQFSQVKGIAIESGFFEVVLFNYTKHALLYDYKYEFDQTLQYRFRKKIDAGEEKLLHHFKQDHLNDQPVFSITCWLPDSKGEEADTFSNSIKFKAKQFFNKVSADEFLRTGKFELIFFDKIPFGFVSDFKDLKHVIVEPQSRHPENFVLSKANMPDFIDLHADKLIPGYRKMEPSEILQYQLKQFRNFLESAITHELDNIYVVHGIGKGVLKSEIEKIIAEYPEVVSFNNDYTTRFGFGATEIRLT